MECFVRERDLDMQCFEGVAFSMFLKDMLLLAINKFHNKSFLFL